MDSMDIHKTGAALLCVGLAVGVSVLAAWGLVPDTAPARPAFAIAGVEEPAAVGPVAVPIASRLGQASVQRGADLAGVQCSACHTLDQGGAAMVGPNLYGVVGRAVAGDPDYRYSDALTALGGQWTTARLDRWLTRPQAMAPGTRMGFAGLADPGQRADLVAFLVSLAPAADAGVQQGAHEAAARCGFCHSFTKNGGTMVGPNLYGVVGRGIAQVPGYAYSAALSAHRGTWTEAALDAWLTDPQHFAPGTKMGFAGLADPVGRGQLIAFLRTLSP